MKGWQIRLWESFMMLVSVVIVAALAYLLVKIIIYLN